MATSKKRRPRRVPHCRICGVRIPCEPKDHWGYCDFYEGDDPIVGVVGV